MILWSKHTVAVTAKQSVMVDECHGVIISLVFRHIVEHVSPQRNRVISGNIIAILVCCKADHATFGVIHAVYLR